jgi:hypothetical protein
MVSILNNFFNIIKYKTNLLEDKIKNKFLKTLSDIINNENFRKLHKFMII